MSPELLRRMMDFRRSMAICGTTPDGHLSSTTIYGAFKRDWLGLYVMILAFDRGEI